MPPSIPTVPLKDERAITAIAFSTGSALSKKDATASVIQALEGGFDRVDTAQAYHNEVEEALRQAFGKSSGYYGDEKVDPEGQTLGKLGREDIRVTTKYGLGLPSVGLYLIHNPQVAPDILKTWPGLESTHAHGKTESIVVSNFSVDQLKLIAENGDVIPAVYQVRFRIRLTDGLYALTAANYNEF